MPSLPVAGAGSVLEMVKDSSVIQR
jgi:hypothetical protein